MLSNENLKPEIWKQSKSYFVRNTVIRIEKSISILTTAVVSVLFRAFGSPGTSCKKITF